jgi:hypothetical protein
MTCAIQQLLDQETYSRPVPTDESTRMIREPHCAERRCDVYERTTGKLPNQCSSLKASAEFEPSERCGDFTQALFAERLLLTTCDVVDEFALPEQRLLKVHLQLHEARSLPAEE